jgi:hypothetical protein
MIISIFGMTSDSTFHSEEPNKTKPPLQVLAVVEGNSEKMRFRDQTRDGEINWIKHKIIYLFITSHFSRFLSTAGLESDSLLKIQIYVDKPFHYVR